MRSYGTDSFGAGKAKDLATKNKLPKKLKIWLKETKLELKGSEKGLESSFSHERRHASVWG